MTFFERLKAGTGELLQLKGALYWRDRGWEVETDRTCLLLDAAHTDQGIVWNAWSRIAHFRPWGRRYALLLIDGSPQWICLSREDINFK